MASRARYHARVSDQALFDELRERLEAAPFYQWSGVTLVSAEPGQVSVALEAGPQHLNLQGLVHGGLLATLADTAMGLAVRTLLESGRPHVTAQLGIQYLRPAAEGRIIARARVLRAGRLVAHAESDVVDSGENLLAKATATLSVALPGSSPA